MARRSKNLQVVLSAIFGVAGSAALAETMTLTSARDNTLYQDTFGNLSNGTGEYFFVGRTQGSSIRRGLLRFDLTSLPAGARVNSAVLHLRISRTQVAGVPIFFHRTLADWGEGASNSGNLGGMGAAAAANDATWVHRFSATAQWVTPGGDFDPTPSGQFTANGVGPHVWTASAAMIADLQYWFDHPELNFGWCLIGDESAQSSNRFNSRENIAATVRPRIAIDFTPPTDCSGTLFTLGDTDGSGSVDGGDIRGFVETVIEQPGPPSERRCASDMNGNGFVDANDLSAFLSLILSG